MKRVATAFALAVTAGLFLAPQNAAQAGSYGAHSASAPHTKHARQAAKSYRSADQHRCYRGLFGVRVCDTGKRHRQFGPYDYDYAIGKGYHILR